MKNLVSIITITILLLGASQVHAQKTNKTETIVIKTSTQCEMCKERIEKAMAYEKGIVSSELNIPKQELTVVYKPTKTTPDNIRKAISVVGYDADDVKADQKAHDNLPNCCQKGAHIK